MIEDKILYVTSADFKLFEALGPKFMSSWMQHHGNHHALFMGLEGTEVGITGNIFMHDLDEDALLQQWLIDNRDVIPNYYGGFAEPCICPGTKDSDGKEIRHARHVQCPKLKAAEYRWRASRCPWQYMNRRASRFFRKVVTLQRASRIGYRYLMWVDIDSAFLAPMLVDQLTRQFLRRNGIGYFRGPRRECAETGVILFDLLNGGDEFLDAHIQKFISREYLKYARWDDGFVFTQVIEESFKEDSIDIVGRDCGTNNVIPTTGMSEFIFHDKGATTRQLNLVE